MSGRDINLCIQILRSENKELFLSAANAFKNPDEGPSVGDSCGDTGMATRFAHQSVNRR